MRKIIFVFLILLCCGVTSQVSAQTKIGVKAGLNYAAFAPVPSNVDAQIKREFGWGFGAFVRLKVPLVTLYFQPEMLLTQKKGTLEGAGNLARSSVTQTNTYLDVPLLVGVNMAAGLFRVNAGPIISFVLNEKLSSGNDVINTNTTLYGWQAGVGSDIKKFTIDIRYENIASEYNQGTQDLRPNAIWFTVGYAF